MSPGNPSAGAVPKRTIRKVSLWVDGKGERYRQDQGPDQNLAVITFSELGVHSVSDRHGAVNYITQTKIKDGETYTYRMAVPVALDDSTVSLSLGQATPVKSRCSAA